MPNDHNYVVVTEQDFNLMVKYFESFSESVFASNALYHLYKSNNYTLNRKIFDEMVEYICNSGEGAYYIYSILCTY